MKPQRLNTKALQRRAAALGIDTVVEMSRRSGVPQWTLYRITQGRQDTATPSQVIALASALNVEPSELLLDEAKAS